jgi:hypothetical protein
MPDTKSIKNLQLCGFDRIMIKRAISNLVYVGVCEPNLNQIISQLQAMRQYCRDSATRNKQTEYHARMEK